MTRRLYTLLLRLLLPLALLRLYWRSLKSPAYRRRVPERLALGPAAPATQIWIHAVSVGEVQAAEPLIRRMIDRDPALSVLVTTTTPTGAERLRERFGGGVAHRYTPYDLPGILDRFLDRTTPALLIVMETEIWPNTLAACATRGIPVILANARLSERSAGGYRRFARLTREALRGFDLIAAQAKADAERFVSLGADPDRVQVTGSIKFDLRQPASLVDRAEAMRRAWGGQRSVWVAASTHEGEDGPILTAHQQIRTVVPDALLVLVPRHPERFERVAELVTRQGLTLARRSRQEPCTRSTSVFLGDTMGELPIFLAAADAAFMGGSLVPTGGHNLLEAAAAGVPVAIGPHHFNFAAITELLCAEEGAIEIADAQALARLMISWLSDATERARIGENGRRVVESNRGALDRLVTLIEARLPKTRD
ncbi:lipid IV(A) 3-deoxy-D-manno-octulosonic acid transferase [Thiocapsa marina]|uniref:3-deoxy-D-manno-octulosonic acid transferase n=1 Tax=Thiocapsa marina 5811 TaxID=768671 RepID=F9UDU3_9GAMM|nr:lipid IV(A) 3-deoxy-D-manno-octulosonic acid transferase [Thiocapsa marina]EGV17500.1 Three-deoxy-D-manno-octulosonic-acid transferase domain-containing protein [Thiocapsa marina 5811]